MRYIRYKTGNTRKNNQFISHTRLTAMKVVLKITKQKYLRALEGDHSKKNICTCNRNMLLILRLIRFMRKKRKKEMEKEKSGLSKTESCSIVRNVLELSRREVYCTKPISDGQFYPPPPPLLHHSWSDGGQPKRCSGRFGIRNKITDCQLEGMERENTKIGRLIGISATIILIIWLNMVVLLMNQGPSMNFN